MQRKKSKIYIFVSRHYHYFSDLYIYHRNTNNFLIGCHCSYCYYFLMQQIWSEFEVGYIANRVATVMLSISAYTAAPAALYGAPKLKKWFKRNACEFIHLREQNCQYKLYRFKLTVKFAIYWPKKLNCFSYTLSNNFDDLIKMI